MLSSRPTVARVHTKTLLGRGQAPNPPSIHNPKAPDSLHLSLYSLPSHTHTHTHARAHTHTHPQTHTLWNQGPSSQGYGFSSGHVWMWELDLKKAERRRIDAFELWCWKRLLSVPWTARRSNQPILNEISLGISLEGILWPPHVKSWFIGKDSDAGRDWGQEEKGTTVDEMAG